MYDSVVFRTLTRLCNRHHCLNSRTFYNPQIEIFVPLAIPPHTPLLHPLAITTVLPVSVDLPGVHILYKWIHSYSMWPFLSGFYWTYWFSVSCCSMNWFLSFNGWIIFPCMAVPHFVYCKLIDIWAVSIFGCYKWCSCEHSGTSFVFLVHLDIQLGE